MRKHTWCVVCGRLQYETPSGITCENGHGGAEGLPVDVLSDREKHMLGLDLDNVLEEHEHPGTIDPHKV